MERITEKKLQETLAKVNEKRHTNMIVFPNMYGYGIAPRGGCFTNYFNGSAKECYAFMQGLLCEPIINN